MRPAPPNHRQPNPSKIFGYASPISTSTNARTANAGVCTSSPRFNPRGRERHHDLRRSSPRHRLRAPASRPAPGELVQTPRVDPHLPICHSRQCNPFANQYRRDTPCATEHFVFRASPPPRATPRTLHTPSRLALIPAVQSNRFYPSCSRTPDKILFVGHQGPCRSEGSRFPEFQLHSVGSRLRIRLCDVIPGQRQSKDWPHARSRYPGQHNWRHPRSGGSCAASFLLVQ